MKTLVTGGAGFIGSHLVDSLLADGHEVIVLDNHSTGRPLNLAHCADNPLLKHIEIDITHGDAIAPLFRGVEVVYHLAALADIVPSIVNPMGYFHSNVNGTANVMQAVRHSGSVRKVVYAASSSCYGIPDVYPTPEDAEMRPQYPYALTKRLGEECVMHWSQVYNIPANSLRLFNVYGPRSRTSGTYGAVFGVFLAQKLAREPYTIVGDGTQTRDFTYVTDVVRAFRMAAEKDVSGKIMNVGSDNTYSVNRLVELLGGEVTYIPKRPGEPDCTFADTTRIKMYLGWEPQVSFEEGVSRMLENIEYWREAPVWTPDKITEATSDWFKYLSDK